MSANDPRLAGATSSDEDRPGSSAGPAIMTVIAPSGLASMRAHLGGGLAVVESRRFLRECLGEAIEAAIPLPLQSYNSLRALEADAETSNVRLVVLSWVDWEDSARVESLQALKRLMAALPRVAVVVLAGAQDPEMARLALASGARGYIPMSLGLEIAIEALRFVLAGGTYAPPEILLSARSAAAPGHADAARNVVTARELLVVKAIQQGKPNKVIGFELNMCESTVKIHIRHLMRKLGAKNRTDLAIRARDVFKNWD